MGDGADRESLESASRATRVKSIFTGFVNIDQLAPYYSAADILVHPAELEQFGMITVEAAILGLPMILSDRVGAIGATSVARPGENTIVYPCGDVDALADAIHCLINQPETRARMREASLRISLDHDGSKSVAGVLAAARHCLANNL